jgi:NAD(P)-dependent dehydrogenase (short-subunit alcohol dehydrogenase family)
MTRRHRAMAVIPRLATPDDVADAVAFLASGQARFITGEVLHVCGGAQLAPAP